MMDRCAAPGDIIPRYQGGPGSHRAVKQTLIMISVVQI